MRTSEKYNAMTEEYKKLCNDTFTACKDLSHEFKTEQELFDSIVNYYYNEFTAPPAGWFNYFD